MSLQIPDYIIDERLITAVKRNVISYLSSYFFNNPRNIYQYYYHISSKSDTGIFSTLFFPPARYILTPVGYAVLYNSPRSLEYLLKNGANPNVSGVVVDCPVEDAKLRWKLNLFRLHEIYPVCLTTPDSDVFVKLVEWGCNLNMEYKLRFRLVTMEETKERFEICHGIWELTWIFWNKMREPINILRITDLLLVNGMNSTYIMRRVNLGPMLKKIFKSPVTDLPSIEESIFIIDLMKILLLSGCDFDETKVVDYILPCVEIFFIDDALINSLQQSIVQQYKILQGIANVSRVFRKHLQNKSSTYTKLPHLSDEKFQSLEVICVIAIRRRLTGIYFNKKLASFNVDMDIKEVIQLGIPGSQRYRFAFEDPSISKEKEAEKPPGET